MKRVLTWIAAYALRFAACVLVLPTCVFALVFSFGCHLFERSDRMLGRSKWLPYWECNSDGEPVRPVDRD